MRVVVQLVARIQISFIHERQCMRAYDDSCGVRLDDAASSACRGARVFCDMLHPCMGGPLELWWSMWLAPWCSRIFISRLSIRCFPACMLHMSVCVCVCSIFTHLQFLDAFYKYPRIVRHSVSFLRIYVYIHSIYMYNIYIYIIATYKL